MFLILLFFTIHKWQMMLGAEKMKGKAKESLIALFLNNVPKKKTFMAVGTRKKKRKRKRKKNKKNKKKNT